MNFWKTYLHQMLQLKTNTLKRVPLRVSYRQYPPPSVTAILHHALEDLARAKDPEDNTISQSREMQHSES